MAGPYTKTAPGTVQLHNAATTGNGNAIHMRGQSHLVTLVLQSNGTTSGGTLSIEEAFYDLNGPEYTGTWSVIQTVNASTFTGNAQIVVHVFASCSSVRARISSDITGGGTVSVWVWGN